MKKRLLSALCMLMFCAAMVGCAAHTHVVGNGSDQGQTMEERQWYILFGLVPLNDVDTKVMAGNDDNYTIYTETSFLDVVMNIVTGIVTVNSRTVTVTK